MRVIIDITKLSRDAIQDIIDQASGYVLALRENNIKDAGFFLTQLEEALTSYSLIPDQE